MIKIKYSVLILFVILQSINAQFKLIDEKISGNSYKLAFETLPSDYQIINSKSGTHLLFNEYVDESKPGTFMFPKAELFIAIPPNCIPQIKFEITEKEYLEEKPYFNPEISINKEGIFKYDFSLVNKLSMENDFLNHGIIQMGKNVCIHFTVALFNYNPELNKTYRIKNFSVELNNISQQSIQKQENYFGVNDAIINKKYAVNFFQMENNIGKEVSDDWIDYQREYIKLGLANDGVYRIKHTDLLNLGINIAQINPKTFQLFWKGKEVPIYVNGEDDNNFDPNDFIEFVGYKNYGGKHREINQYNQPYNEYLDRYSDTTVVWLTWGKQNGLRNSVANLPAGSAVKTINYFNQLVHYEKNIWFDFSTDQLVRRQFPDWTENETWLWNTQGVGTIELPFTVSNLVTNKTAKAFVKLQSYASDKTKNAHRVGLAINSDNKIYDSLSFDNYQQRIIKAVFNSNLLSNGNNKLRSVSYPTQASVNSVFHDWYEIEYPRFLLFSNDSISFKFNDYNISEMVNYEISNYKGNPISIYKSEGILNTVRITNYNSFLDKIVFTDLLDSSKTFFICPSTKILSPKIFYNKRFTNIRSNSNNAEYLIITHPKLMNSALEYSNFIKQSYNKKVLVVNVFDIYDEFNYGFLSAESIKDFMQTAYTAWASPKIEHVLLLGSANYDYYENRQKQLPAPDHPNLVPSYGVPVSDAWFINWNSSTFYNPLIKIGRIPARTEEEVRNYLNKHKNCLSKGYSELNKRFLFFSGGVGNNQNELDQLRNSNQYVIDNFIKPSPIGGIVNHFYKTLNPNTNFGPFNVSKIQNAIDSSGVFISYLGHSGTQTWDNSITEPKQLNNIVNANPLITDFGCSTAKFAEPDVTSFSELFVNGKDGQAIAYIGNTSLGFTSSSIVAPKLFYETILKDSVLNIADALNKTKVKLLTQYSSSNVNKIFSLTNSLIGDPIISLKVPPKPNLNISTNDVSFTPPKVTNQDDSVKCTIRYKNLGRTINKNFTATIKDNYNSSVIFDRNITRKIPLFMDSLVIFIPIKNKPGKHKILVQLDIEKNIDELNENDNNTEISLVVTNSSIRVLTSYDYSNALNVIKILNPTTKSSATNIDYQLSTNSLFTNPISSSVQFGELFTKINLGALQNGNRYWFRSKSSDQVNYDFTKSFVNSFKSGFLLNDSVSFATGTKQNTVIDKNVHLGKETVSIEAISSGFNDGNTGVITKNNQNYIPWPNRGHNVCVFDGNTFALKLFQTYDLLFGGTAAQDSYAKMLDSLKTSDILVIVIVDEGSINLNASLKQKLKSFGSKYVDSLGFRESWTLIGKKNTPIGSAVESYAKIFKGRAIAKTSFEKKSTSGFYATQFIGPSTEWKQFEITYLKPGDSKLSYSIIGKNSNNKIDTLQTNTVTANIIDISGQTFRSYQYLQLKLKLEASANSDSPEINSMFCNYKNVPELGLNYQTVSVNKDTVDQGEIVNLTFNVHNAGETTAQNFKILVEIAKKDNTKEKIFETTVDSIAAEQKKQFNINYSTAAVTGLIQFNIAADPENKILEFFKDNNIYSVPVFVKPNNKPASLKLSFNGNDIINGDYISPNPEINIELTDLSLIPISDTTFVKMYLNNKIVPYKNNSSVKYSFSSVNPKYIINYTPHLADGNYIFKVVGKNASGRTIDTSGIVRTFSVKNDLQLMDVYNYPNPFKDETCFTFKLTQIPDELKIKIFTLAGRMIKEFSLTSVELKYDFNRIYWNGRDTDGDLASNGVYLYKVISRKGGETIQTIQKLAIVR